MIEVQPHDMTHDHWMSFSQIVFVLFIVHYAEMDKNLISTADVIHIHRQFFFFSLLNRYHINCEHYKLLSLWIGDHF